MPTTENKSEQQQNYPGLPFTMNAQYIKDLSFENPDPLKNFQQSNIQPELSINVDVRAQSFSDTTFEVDLHLNCEASREKETIFIVELIYSGLMTVQNVPKDILPPLLLIEGPRLLFPFARNIIANITREGGFPQLSLAPIDFAALYQAQKQKGAIKTSEESSDETNQGMDENQKKSKSKKSK